MLRLQQQGRTAKEGCRWMGRVGTAGHGHLGGACPQGPREQAQGTSVRGPGSCRGHRGAKSGAE